MREENLISMGNNDPNKWWALKRFILSLLKVMS